MKTVGIAVIDTSVYIDHSSLSGASIQTMDIIDESRSEEKAEQGHGTAVCSIILKYCKTARIYSFPIFTGNTAGVMIDNLLEVLNYILKNHEMFRVINMSLGVVDFENKEDMRELNKLCNELRKKGIIIVAAYDNSGCMTYPACFRSVIGVDISSEVTKHRDFIYVENSPVNVRGCSRPLRVAWDEPEYMYAMGSSFVAPMISGIIADYLGKQDGLRYNDILSLLKSKANSVKKCKNTRENNCFSVNKAIFLPFNKEIKTIQRLENYLSVQSLGFFDIKAHLVSNKSINDEHTTIKSIESINWNDDFDTVVIGHTSELRKIAGDEWISEIISSATKYNKKVYSLDNTILRYGSKDTEFYFPKVDIEDVEENQFGKLWKYNTPILGVFGTRSQIGKFTFQVLVKKELEKNGYRVGFLSSEVIGQFFGADGIFPYGYQSEVDLADERFVACVNQMMHRIDIKEYDIIITGGQSGILPYEPYNYSRLLINQYLYLLATYPDCIVLCVSIDDDIEYIKQTIAFCESLTCSKVIAIILFPIIREQFLTVTYKERSILNTDDCAAYVEELKKIGIPVYMNTEGECSKIAEEVIRYFSDEEMRR